MEVVADDESEQCLINVDAVASGPHEVRVIVVGDAGEVTIAGTDGWRSTSFRVVTEDELILG